MVHSYKLGGFNIIIDVFSASIHVVDDATFDIWMKYHFSICERMDLIGATNHALDILENLVVYKTI